MISVEFPSPSSTTAGEDPSTQTPEYLAYRGCYKEVVGAITIDPGTVCDALFGAGLITEDVRDHARMDTIINKVKAQKLADAVIDEIKRKPAVFHSFVELLKAPYTLDTVKQLQDSYDAEAKLQLKCVQAESAQNEVSSEDESFHSATSDIDDSAFICPFCREVECTLERFFSKEGCPKMSESMECMKLFPYLNIRNLNASDIIDLEGKLIRETKDIRIKFSDFSVFTWMSLERQQVLKGMKDSILSTESIDEIDQTEIRQADCLSEVFTVLRVHGYISFFNYAIVEQLINHFGSVEDQERLGKYLSAFNTFCQRNVFQVPLSAFHCQSRPTAKCFVVKCEQKTLSLKGVEHIKHKVSEVFGLHLSALQLSTVKKGCVELHILTTVAVFDRIFPVSPSKQSALKKIGVRIHCSEGATKKELVNEADDVKSKLQWDESPREEANSLSLLSSRDESPLPLLHSTESHELSEMDSLIQALLDGSAFRFKKERKASSDDRILSDEEGQNEHVKSVTQQGREPLQDSPIPSVEDPFSTVPPSVVTEFVQDVLESLSPNDEIALKSHQEFGSSPLLAACKRGQFKTAMLLIDMGADLNQCDVCGMTPLTVACADGHTDFAKFLISKGAEVNKSLENGTTPLLAACWGGHTDTVRMLIEQGADLSQCDEVGISALVVAHLIDHKGVDILIANGAKYTEEDKAKLQHVCSYPLVSVTPASTCISESANHSDYGSTQSLSSSSRSIISDCEFQTTSVQRSVSIRSFGSEFSTMASSGYRSISASVRSIVSESRSMACSEYRSCSPSSPHSDSGSTTFPAGFLSSPSESISDIGSTSGTSTPLSGKYGSTPSVTELWHAAVHPPSQDSIPVLLSHIPDSIPQHPQHIHPPHHHTLTTHPLVTHTRSALLTQIDEETDKQIKFRFTDV